MHTLAEHLNRVGSSSAKVICGLFRSAPAPFCNIAYRILDIAYVLGRPRGGCLENTVLSFSSGCLRARLANMSPLPSLINENVWCVCDVDYVRLTSQVASLIHMHVHLGNSETLRRMIRTVDPPADSTLKPNDTPSGK